MRFFRERKRQRNLGEFMASLVALGNQLEQRGWIRAPTGSTSWLQAGRGWRVDGLFRGEEGSDFVVDLGRSTHLDPDDSLRVFGSVHEVISFLDDYERTEPAEEFDQFASGLSERGFLSRVNEEKTKVWQQGNVQAVASLLPVRRGGELGWIFSARVIRPGTDRALSKSGSPKEILAFVDQALEDTE